MDLTASQGDFTGSQTDLKRYDKISQKSWDITEISIVRRFHGEISWDPNRISWNHWIHTPHALPIIFILDSNPWSIVWQYLRIVAGLENCQILWKGIQYGSAFKNRSFQTSSKFGKTLRTTESECLWRLRRPATASGACPVSGTLWWSSADVRMADRDISISVVAREPVSQYALDTGLQRRKAEARRMGRQAGETVKLMLHGCHDAVCQRHGLVPNYLREDYQ